VRRRRGGSGATAFPYHGPRACRAVASVAIVNIGTGIPTVVVPAPFTNLGKKQGKIQAEVRENL
jgi:hypothetical protein